MSNFDQTSGSRKSRFIKYVAVASFLTGIIYLGICMKCYFRGDFLKAGAQADPTPSQLQGWIGLLRLAYFRIVPGASVLLIINSIIIWKSSKEKR